MFTVSLAEHFDKRNYIVRKIFEEFSKPIFKNVFFINIGYLRAESDFYEFNVEKWSMKPHVFCFDVYNEQYYYPVVMLVNNVRSLLDFVPENMTVARIKDIVKPVIIAPKVDAIKKVI